MTSRQGSRPEARVALALGAAAALLLLPPRPAPALAAQTAPPAAADRRSVCIRDSCFDAELAVTEAERARGLMFREVLPAGRGMLFVFPAEAPHTFWMKNTRIELDIVFIDGGRRVVSIAHRAQPCRAEPCPHYAPAGNAAYALEIAGGTAAARGFAPGDPVVFREALPTR